MEIAEIFSSTAMSIWKVESHCVWNIMHANISCENIIQCMQCIYCLCPNNNERISKKKPFLFAPMKFIAEYESIMKIRLINLPKRKSWNLRPIPFNTLSLYPIGWSLVASNKILIPRTLNHPIPILPCCSRNKVAVQAKWKIFH